MKKLEINVVAGDKKVPGCMVEEYGKQWNDRNGEIINRFMENGKELGSIFLEEVNIKNVQTVRKIISYLAEVSYTGENGCWNLFNLADEAGLKVENIKNEYVEVTEEILNHYKRLGFVEGSEMPSIGSGINLEVDEIRIPLIDFENKTAETVVIRNIYFND